METPDFWKHVAVGTMLIVVFIIILKPRKPDYNNACIKDYEELKRQICSCKTIADCDLVEKDMEAYWDSYYKVANVELLRSQYTTLICELSYIKDFIRYGQGPMKLSSS